MSDGIEDYVMPRKEIYALKRDEGSMQDVNRATTEQTVEEKLAFAHACTGEALFSQALQRIEQLAKAGNVTGTKIVISYPEVLDKHDRDTLVSWLYSPCESFGDTVYNIEVFVGQD